MSDSPAPNDRTPFLPPNWNELAPLLDQLLDLPTAERADRLRQIGQGNAALQRQLAELLAEVEQGMPLLDEPATRRFNDLAADASTEPVPEVLGERYRIGKELGRGGMSSVYLAHDLKHGRDVAVKIIRSDLAASLGHDRFLREIEIAARLRHPNIVPLFDSGEVENSLFFVMPYEEGLSLRERLRETGALPVFDAVSVLRDVARALAYAHEHGVVHRDVKPDNVMLSGGAAVVTDFGIAKAIAAASERPNEDGPPAGTLTQAGTVIGTPAYMAPEQATGDSAIDHRVDIYAFGCLGYELFAGHPPFQERATHLLIAAHIATTPRPLAEVREDVPPAVADLLARCLAKAPADRPQSARDLLASLDGASNTPVAAPSPSRTGRPRVSQVSRTRWMAAATAFVAVAAIGGYFATRTASATGPITVAVLPFGNIDRDSAIALIADGLGDEVASGLARVPGILIKSRTGARAYRGQLAPDVTEAGARLKADYLVTAVIRQERGRWILSAELERAADATSLWDSAFVIDPNAQAAVADSVAGDLTAALRRLFPRAVGVGPVRLAHQRTSNPEAFRLYVAGQEKLARRGQSVNEAVGLFRRAVHEDTLYAPAYSGLSMALALAPWFHFVPPSELHDELVAAARRALALDSTQSVPHVALGVALWQMYDWTGAAAEMDTAVRLDPRNVEARVQYSRMLVSIGRHQEGLAQIRVARALDPASALVLSHMANAYLRVGQFDSAVTETRHAFETDSANLSTRLIRVWVYLAMDSLQAAHALAVRLSPFVPMVGNYLAMSGDLDGARRLLTRLDARPPVWGDETIRAMTYLGIGDTARALSALERATDAHELWPQSTILTDATFDEIRKSARFRELLGRVGLNDYAASIVNR